MSGGFERFAAGKGDASPVPPPKPASRWIAPVPAGAPAMPTHHPKLGAPSKRWAYCDKEGRTLLEVWRFDANGDKEIRPLTLRQEQGALRWEWRGPTGPSPLYGLKSLSDRADAPVLIVEGEKTADAAGALFPGYVVVTWQGGANSVAKADWSPLALRDVTVLPDADAPGRAAADAVAQHVLKAKARDVRIVTLPETVPNGWDVADAMPDGFDLEALARAIKAAGAVYSAKAVAVSQDGRGVIWPAGIVMEDSGLFYLEPVRGGEPHKVRLSDRFAVLGEARAPDGEGWALVIAFEDRDGKAKQSIIPKAKLASGGADARSELMALGLWIVTGRGHSERFVAALAGVRSDRRLLLHDRTGWAGNRFVLPSRAIGAGPEAGLFTGDARGFYYATRGDLKSWRDSVAAPLAHQVMGLFALAVGLAGPTLKLMGEDGGGFHLRGGSSSGKTTLARIAGSVWGGGGPLGFGQSWRTTANGLEAVAAGHSDTLLVLDELGLLAPEEAGAAAYALTSGQAKARAKTDGGMRARLEWRAMLLSTGEIALADHVRAGRRGEKPMAGQELRMIDISAEHGAGVWDASAEGFDPAAFSETMRTATDAHYGHAGPAFVEWLTAYPLIAAGALREGVAAFEAVAVNDGDTGQVRRAARRFAVVASAGEAAILAGVLPFPKGAVQAAVLLVFERWARTFGRTRLHEESDALRTLKRAIEANDARFGTLREDDDQELGDRTGEARGLATLGYRWRDSKGTAFYLFHEAGWLEVFIGMDAKRAAKVVRDAGLLGVDEGRLTKKVRRRGRLETFYAVKGDLLSLDFD